MQPSCRTFYHILCDKATERRDLHLFASAHLADQSATSGAKSAGTQMFRVRTATPRPDGKSVPAARYLREKSVICNPWSFTSLMVECPEGASPGNRLSVATEEKDARDEDRDRLHKALEDGVDAKAQFGKGLK